MPSPMPGPPGFRGGGGFRNFMRIMTNPMVQGDNSPWLVIVKLVILSLFAYWFYVRAIKNNVFLYLGIGLDVLALFVGIFWTGEQLTKTGIILSAIPFFAVYVVICAIINSQMFYHLPRAGVMPREEIIDLDKGELKLPFAILSAFLLIILLRYIFARYFVTLRYVGINVEGQFAFIYYFTAAAIAGYISSLITPYRVDRGQFAVFQTQDAEAKIEAVNVLAFEKEVSIIEIIAAFALAFAGTILIPYFASQKKEDMDIFGILIILGIISSIIYFHFYKGKPTEREGSNFPR
ncbi:MAG: hypothetical protein ACLFQV_06090 [Vulcanimicrobiota bacterium]